MVLKSYIIAMRHPVVPVLNSVFKYARIGNRKENNFDILKPSLTC